jgi:hypothetical protein
MVKGLVGLSLISLLLGGSAEGALLQVRGAVHLHTTFSSGILSPEELVEEARRQKLGALILADSFLLRFEYGVLPFRNLVRRVVEKPSVHRLGHKGWLEAVEAAQAGVPGVIVIPGVEVMPYYYWTGSLMRGDLTLRDVQKNLLVVGLSRPEHYAELPAIGNGGLFQPSPMGLVGIALALVTMGGGLLLLRARRRGIRLAGWATLGLGLLALLDAVTASRLNPYRGNLGIEPYQRLIEYAEARGGAAFWSFPEARDFQKIGWGRLGTVTLRTEPYPEALLQSQGYTGFGAVYQDNVTLTEPGEQWDRLLSEYARGQRSRPVWGIGELGYHGPPKSLGDVLTVFLVPELSRAAILSALKAGRFYAVQPPPDYSLVLEEFSIGQENGNGWTPMGGELLAETRGPLLIRLGVSASDGREVPFTLRLIRSGRLLSLLRERTPFEAVLQTDPPERGTGEFLRVEITEPHRLLANPIFVRRRT